MVVCGRGRGHASVKEMPCNRGSTKPDAAQTNDVTVVKYNVAQVKWSGVIVAVCFARQRDDFWLTNVKQAILHVKLDFFICWQHI